MKLSPILTDGLVCFHCKSPNTKWYYNVMSYKGLCHNQFHASVLRLNNILQSTDFSFRAIMMLTFLACL